MGLSLSLSGIINKSEKEVTIALRNYLERKSGGLELADIDNENKNFSVIEEANGNTTIFYPAYFFKWDECASSLSEALNTPVFVLQIYDGDFWAYTLFYNGEVKDQFMPIPDYFDENVSDAEINSWKGNVQILIEYVPYLKKEDIEKYLIRWDLELEETKAYDDDEFTNCEWQLTDFMKKLRLPYPIDDEGKPKGNVYKFWSTDIPLTDEPIGPYIVSAQAIKNANKAWWKFW